ncbi:hypothetical protein ACRALDRAFT_205230 [Sodiomyces alcalophilus JCM 7366]|uniref:uncharacterized protein n=1 Tax=Sodiomyces alcalophilus JCM 7366 TaxID=591952 RepID=UPI0039B40371
MKIGDGSVPIRLDRPTTWQLSELFLDPNCSTTYFQNVITTHLYEITVNTTHILRLDDCSCRNFSVSLPAFETVERNFIFRLGARRLGFRPLTNSSSDLQKTKTSQFNRIQTYILPSKLVAFHGAKPHCPVLSSTPCPIGAFSREDDRSFTILVEILSLASV